MRLIELVMNNVGECPLQWTAAAAPPTADTNQGYPEGRASE